jgi:hypothetical protein
MGVVEQDLRKCPNCDRLVDNADMVWVNDRYGIPYKKVCPECIQEVEDEIGGWEFDPDFAGERLEDDY